MDVEILKNFNIILQVISSQHKVNSEKLKQICTDTFFKLEHQFGNKCLTPSIHSLLFHSWKMVDRFDIPLGRLSESSIELLHKYTKKAKNGFCRTFSTVSENEDLFRRMQMESDIIISSIRSTMATVNAREINEECFPYFYSKSTKFISWRF